MDIVLIVLISVGSFMSGYLWRSGEVTGLRETIEFFKKRLEMEQDDSIQLLKKILEVEYEKQNKINLQK